MLGAIVGDIVGSRFEFNNHKSKDFDLFTDQCFVTDDSIMTLAIAKALMETVKAESALFHHFKDSFYRRLSQAAIHFMQSIGRPYPSCGYGGRFHQWIYSDRPEAYNSYGNGAAMRVSAAGLFAVRPKELVLLAKAVTAVTHNHPEGIKGAEATALAICMAKKGALKEEIRERISQDYYPLDFTVDAIRPSYRFNETCQETVPQAMACFLESESFEDAIRTAISIGGDSDTVAAITGSIAEAYYGVPDPIRKQALAFLDPKLRALFDEWEAFCPPDVQPHRLMTRYLGRLDEDLDLDSPWIDTMLKDWHAAGLMDTDYREHMKELGVRELPGHALRLDQEALKADSIRTLITMAFRHEYLVEGALEDYLRTGALTRWLKRLKNLDRQDGTRSLLGLEIAWPGMDRPRQIFFDPGDVRALEIDRDYLAYWLADYGNTVGAYKPGWFLTAAFDDGYCFYSQGQDAYPPGWDHFLDLLGLPAAGGKTEEGKDHV